MLLTSMDFNLAEDMGLKREWIPFRWSLILNPFMFTGIISLLPRFNVYWHYGWGWDKPGTPSAGIHMLTPHVWIDRQTIRECVRKTCTEDPL